MVIALMFPPLLMGSGAALDASYAITLRSELSHITKLACTRLSTSASRAATPTEQAALTGATIDAQLKESRLDPAKTAFTFTPASGGVARVQARSVYHSKIMQVFGFEEIGVTADETCEFTLRVPTAAPEQCSSTVPQYDISGTSATTTFENAKLRWQVHNETCDWYFRTIQTWSVNEGSVEFPVIVWYRRDRAYLWCGIAPAPDEMLIGIVARDGEQVYARDLLSSDTERGKTSVSYTDLPAGGGDLVLQPAYGYPAILPETCYAAPRQPGPPPRPADQVIRLPAPAPTPPPPDYYEPPYAGPPVLTPMYAGHPTNEQADNAWSSTAPLSPPAPAPAPTPSPAPAPAPAPTPTPTPTPTPSPTPTPTPSPTPTPTPMPAPAPAPASNPCSGSSGGVSQTATTRATSGGTATISGSVSGGGGCGGTNSSSLNQTTRNGRTNGTVTATNGTNTSNSSIQNAGNSGTQSGSANANNVQTHAHGAPASTFNSVDTWW